jgi:hypothetical protein
MTILSLHVFSGHEHSVCHSKVEKHIHKKELDCTLNLIKQSHSYLESNTYNSKLTTTISNNCSLQYNFLQAHYQLSFSLRGPPVYI